MSKIELQKKTKAKPATVEAYWFENKGAGSAKTLFHRITVPLEAFDSGIDSDSQPVTTAIIFDWYELGLDSPNELVGLNLSHEKYPESEASVYIGSVHNWCDAKFLHIKEDESGGVIIEGEVFVEFANEDVADNETFKFTTSLEAA
jgi:hypothetical protein